jgi:ribosomal protein S1
MVEIGSVISAKVVRIEPYGIYLSHGDETVIVLAPELSWLGKGDVSDGIRVGQALDVLAFRYNYQTQEIVGSIRRLHPEQNPYRQLSRLEPGTVLHGEVTGIYNDGASVRLTNGTRGSIPRHRIGPRGLTRGQTVEVTIAALDMEEGVLTLELVQQESNPPIQPAAHLVVGAPV